MTASWVGLRRALARAAEPPRTLRGLSILCPSSLDPIALQIAAELRVRPAQIVTTIELLDGGATVPFIARYRKEATGLGSLRADLMALAQTLAEFLHSNAGRAIIRMLLNDGDNNELRAIAIAAYGDVSRQAAWITLEAAVHRGELKSAVEPTTLLFTLAGALIHRVLVERAVASPTFVEGVVDMLLHGAATQNS